MSTLRPWMDPIEWSQVSAAVYAVAPAVVLEWGAGGSTVQLSKMAGHVYSIEHDPQWADEVKKSLPVGTTNVTLRCARADVPEPSTEDWHWRTRAEYDPAVLESYVQAPRQMGITPDVVLVDGRARRFCLSEGFRLLRPGGLLILHDAQRSAYHDALPKGTKFLAPWRQGQVCLARKG